MPIRFTANSFIETAEREPQRFMRNKRTGEFWAKGGGWTDEIEKAATVRDIPQALEFCHWYGLQEVEFVLLSQERDCEFTLDLSGERIRHLSGIMSTR